MHQGTRVSRKGAVLSFSLRNVATLAIALFLGLLAVLMARSYIEGARLPATVLPSAKNMVSVVVAAQALPRGTPIGPQVLKLAQVAPDAVPAGAFREVHQLDSDPGRPRVTLRAVAANEPLLPATVSGPGGRAGLSGTLEPGMRAISLRSNDVAGVGGFILPGDRVDVLLTRTVGNEQNNSVAQVLAENVRVLGVDQSADENTDKPVVAKSVTVEVTPVEAQAISLGLSVGTVSLSLRANDDAAMVKRQDIRVSDLSSGERHPSRPAAPKIRIVRGTDVSFYSFDSGATK